MSMSIWAERRMFPGQTKLKKFFERAAYGLLDILMSKFEICDWLNDTKVFV